MSLRGADLLLALGGGMAAFELALLGRLLQLQAACGLCLLSAGLSAAVLALAWRLPSTRRADEDAVLAGCGAALAAAAAAAIFSAQGSLPVPEEEQAAARRGVALSAAPRRRLSAVGDGAVRRAVARPHRLPLQPPRARVVGEAGGARRKDVRRLVVLALRRPKGDSRRRGDGRGRLLRRVLARRRRRPERALRRCRGQGVPHLGGAIRTAEAIIKATLGVQYVFFFGYMVLLALRTPCAPNTAICFTYLPGFLSYALKWPADGGTASRVTAPNSSGVRLHASS